MQGFGRLCSGLHIGVMENRIGQPKPCCTAQMFDFGGDMGTPSFTTEFMATKWSQLNMARALRVGTVPENGCLTEAKGSFFF